MTEYQTDLYLLERDKYMFKPVPLVSAISLLLQFYADDPTCRWISDVNQNIVHDRLTEVANN